MSETTIDRTQVDLDRIKQRLDAFWEIGKTDNGGVTRLAYSDKETEAINFLRDELDDRFTVREDFIGNVFAAVEPNVDQSVFLGSHLDSVFNGGRLDGTLGVVTALEAIEVALEIDDPPTPPTLVVFRAEESSRFGQWAIGSRGALGQLTVEDFSATDQSDVPLWQAMQQQGFQPRNLSEPTIDLDQVASFFELHIEQGRVLDERCDNVGVVSSIRAPVRYQIIVEGNYDHSGATPMGMRRDAIAGAAELISEVEHIGTAEEGDLVATVGDISAYDGAINKVCGKVSFPVDLRSNDRPYRDEVESRLLDRINTIADQRDLKVECELVDRSNPVELDERIKETFADAAASLGVSHYCLPSGGGHDAMNFQHESVPTGMLFVPSVEGISHSPREESPEEAIRDATAILASTLLRDPLDTE